MPMPLAALREDRTLRGVQRRKQRGRPVPSVIMRHAFDVAESHRQHRLGTFERLNLALFIHAQNHCIFRRMQVQTYNIPYFLYKKWIAGQLEMLLPVRLDSKGLPDAMHSRFRHPRLGGDLPDTPMRAVSRFGFQGPVTQARHPLLAERSG